MLLTSNNDSNIKKIIQEQGIHYSTTVGMSMYPLLRDRKDRIIVRPNKDKYCISDVILFQRPNGKIILHRIVGENDNHYLVCGDNQYTIEKVSKEFVIGKLVAFYRGNRYVSIKEIRYKFYSWSVILLLPIRRPFLFVSQKLIRIWINALNKFGN